MKQISKTARITMTFIMVGVLSLKAAGQTVPAGKYNTTNYPKDRKIINGIQNSFDQSLSLNDERPSSNKKGNGILF